MAINENNALKARHVSYCGTSGSGKAVAVKQMGLVGPCAALLDIYGDYKPSRRKKLSGLGNGRVVHHYRTRRTFQNAFIEAWASGKPFAVAYQPTIDPKRDTGEQYRAEAIWFGRLMWAAADGNRELHLLWEEMGRYSPSSGKESSIIGECATGGRKYGIVNHFVFQRPVEVSKTITSQSIMKIVGAQETMLDAKFWMDELDCSLDEIKELGRKNLECENAKPEIHRRHYLLKQKGLGNYSKITINY